MSLLSARIGVMYKIEIALLLPALIRRSSAGKSAASVLPLPVGATSKTFSPATICGQAKT